MSKRNIENYLPSVREDGLNTSKAITAQNGVAVVAGGNTTAAFQTGTTTVGPNIYTGSGAPTVTAPKGSIYLRTDGSSTSTRMYVNTDGATTWTAVTTAA
jgi:hypothetical protein